MHRYSRVAPGLAVVGGLAAGAGLITLPCASVAWAQERQIVSSRIEVSTLAASLHLEMADGRHLALSLADGVATANGEVLGEYVVGGDSDGAWRALLDRVYSLSGEPLARELDAWSPDSELGEADLRFLALIEELLDGLAPGAAPAPAPAGNVQPGEDVSAFLARNPDMLQSLAAAIEGMEIAEREFRFGEDRTIPASATIDGNILHAGGRLEVRGHVRGSVTVVDGSLTLAAGSRIEGDVRLMRSQVVNGGSNVGGRFVDLAQERQRLQERQRDILRTEILRDEFATRDARASRTWSGFRFRMQMISEMALALTVTFLVLGFLTFLLTVFGGHRVRAVVDEVRHNPLGSTLAGFAGAYAVLPVFLLVAAALTVTIVGIPVLLVWIPLFPLALALAGLAGFVGVAENIGRWVLGHELGWLRWVDASNTYFVRLVGIGIFLLPVLVGGIMAQLPFVDWVGEVVGVAGLVGWLAALIVGFGAVIVTRGGSRSAHWQAGLADDAFTRADWSDEYDLSEAGGARGGTRRDPASGKDGDDANGGDSGSGEAR